MYGYKLKLPRSMPTPVWACKTFVDRYDWKNKNKSNMIEFSICKASCRTVEIGDQEPITVSGKIFSCMIGDREIKSHAADGVNVEIVSVAVVFDEIIYTGDELCEKDLKENRITSPYIKARALLYKERKLKQAEMFEKSRSLFDEIYKLAIPKKHTFELKKIDQ